MKDFILRTVSTSISALSICVGSAAVGAIFGASFGASAVIAANHARVEIVKRDAVKVETPAEHTHATKTFAPECWASDDTTEVVVCSTPEGHVEPARMLSDLEASELVRNLDALYQSGRRYSKEATQ